MAGNGLITLSPVDAPAYYHFPLEANKDIDYLDRDELYAEPEGILDRTLHHSWKVFSDLNDSRGSSPFSSLILFDDCSISDVSHDCNTICSNRTMLFESWRTHWQCLTLATLSLASPTFTDLSESIKKDIKDTLESFNITDDTQFNGLAVLKATYECAAASCDDKSMGDCNIPKLSEQSYVQGQKVNWSSLYDAISPAICKDITDTVNLDIAGPGVLISYAIQIGLTLLSWLLMHLFTVRKTASHLPILGRKFKAFTDSHPKLLSRLKTIEQSKVAHATYTLLAEFQEAQCFFMMAIHASLLYTNSQPVEINGASSLQSWLRNQQRSRSLEIMGSIPVILIQLVLSRVQSHDYYSLMLTIVVEILASVATARSVERDGDKLHNLFKGQNPVDQCGGNPSIRSFCRPTMDDSIFPVTWQLNLVLLVPAGILCRKIWKDVSRTEWFKKQKAGVSHEKQTTMSAIILVASKVGVIILVLAEIAMVAVIGIFCDILASIIRRSPLRSIAGWNIGQVIAVFLWAPVISKYLWLILCGIEKGFRSRLPPWFVARKADKGNEDCNLTTVTTIKHDHSSVPNDN